MVRFISLDIFETRGFSFVCSAFMTATMMRWKRRRTCIIDISDRERAVRGAPELPNATPTLQRWRTQAGHLSRFVGIAVQPSFEASRSEYSRDKAIEPRSLPIEGPDNKGRKYSSKAAAEDIGQIVGANKNARPADQQGQKSE